MLVMNYWKEQIRLQLHQKSKVLRNKFDQGGEYPIENYKMLM